MNKDSLAIMNRSAYKLCFLPLLVAGFTLCSIARASAQSTSRTFSPGAIRDRCIELTRIKQGGEEGYRECRVSDFGELGAVDGQTWYYALYCLIPGWSDPAQGQCAGSSFNGNYYRTRALLVLAGDTAGVQLVFERAEPEIGVLVYYKPAIVRNAAGTLLHLPVAYDGTGNGNGSEYYIREAGSWQRIESEAWQADLLSRLPVGLSVWKGVWPDLSTLRAETGLYRKGDGNCCPTGGLARIQLAIRGKQFVLESVTFQTDGRDR